MFNVDTKNITDIDDVFEELGMGMIEQIILATYCLLIILIGTFGNGLVLYGSIKYNAIHMDSVSIKLIENLAISDIACTTGVPLQMMTVIVSKKWILGKTLCYIQGFWSFVPYLTELQITTLISIHRLCCIKYPLSWDFTIRNKHVNIIIPCTWVLSVIVVLGFSFVGSFR